MASTSVAVYMDGMTEPKPPTESTKPRRKGGATWHGFVLDDHPIYQGGGWNFLAGKNLKPADKEPPKSAAWKANGALAAGSGARARDPQTGVSNGD